MKLLNSVKELAKKITMDFEGRGYTQITGNTDNQYMSIGWLQWNFGQGTLQPLLMRLFNEHPGIPSQHMPEGGKWLKKSIAEGWEGKWALQTQINNQVVEPWLTALTLVCRTPEFQKIQDEAAEIRYNMATHMCKSFDLKTDRAFCLFFDIAVQNGDLKYFDTSETDYERQLEAITTAAILKTDNKYKDDVRSRKKCIVDGYGYVHGKYYVLAFSDQYVFDRESELMQDLKSLVNKYEGMV
jgi:hypothetical protein